MSSHSKKRLSLNGVSSLLVEAVTFHQQGRVQEAKSCYAHILKSEPNNTIARYYLGLLRLQTGETAAGIADLKQVVKHQPDHVEAHYNLGLAYGQLGNHQQALRCFEHVVDLRPIMPEAHFYLGMTFARQGQPAKALPHFERTIVLKPDLAEAHHNFASALVEMGRYEEALAAFGKAIALKPDVAEAHNGMANALFKLNRHAEAGDQFRHAIRLNPGLSEAYTGLSDVLRTLGQYDAAADCGNKAIRLDPEDAVAHVVHGQALTELGEHGAALNAFEKALALQPDSVAVNSELGAVLNLWGRYEEARYHGDKAISLDPSNVNCRSVQLFQLHFDPDMSATELASRHRAFAECFETPLKDSWKPFDNLPDPERRIHVGFVSADFKAHPVGHFMADLLASLRGSSLELYAYANQWGQDELTERIKPNFDCWRECWAMSDDALAAQIRADGIDILVDLSGHTKGNRLLVFARKPAPVQVTYLGYFDTTGLSAMDYILGNRWLLPENEAHLYTEKFWWLPDAHLCLTTPDVLVEVKPLPALRSGQITFGSFNKTQKLNPGVVACWSRILKAVPDSRLFLKYGPFGDPAVADYYRKLFAGHGIEPQRLILQGASGFKEYLESYNEIDITFDPYPYNGGTTTVQSLWMGVPVLALKGDRYVAHMGESILHTMSLPEWIAKDEDGYVEKAVAFSNDLPTLAALRADLRDRLVASPICDAPRFARNLEDAFRGMWRQWCSR